MPNRLKDALAVAGTIGPQGPIGVTGQGTTGDDSLNTTVVSLMLATASQICRFERTVPWLQEQLDIRVAPYYSAQCPVAKHARGLGCMSTGSSIGSHLLL